MKAAMKVGPFRAQAVVAISTALLGGAARAQLVPAPPPLAAPPPEPPPRAAEDPASGPVPAKVTLDQAVKRALGHNPTVAVAVAEIDRAEALIKQAKAGWYPILNGNGYLYRLDANRLSGGQIVAPIWQVAGNLQLTVPLVAAPAWANTRRAESGRRIADASAADVRRQVAQATARAYLTVMAQHRVVAAVETARASAKDHYDYAHTRLAGGIGRAIDEVRAQQDLATVERQSQDAYVALARAREALGVLVAAPAPLDTTDEANLPPVPSLNEALADAPVRRTDVAVGNARAAQARQVAKDTWAYYAPYLAAIGQPFLTHPATALQPSSGWQAQLVLTLPLYDGGARTGIGRERDALVVEADANVQAALLQAESDVRLGFEAMLRADRGLVAARDAARLAHRAYDLAVTAYRGGASTNIEVLDAARAARDADIAAAQAEDQSRQTRLDLLVASGRFP
jgi:outer membrane protein TolC